MGLHWKKKSINLRKGKKKKESNFLVCQSVYTMALVFSEGCGGDQVKKL